MSAPVAELAAFASPLVLLLPLTGLAVGFLAGLLGIGGGFLMIPVMSWLFATLDPATASHAIHTAIGTSLAIIVPTSVVSARAHWRRGTTDVDALRFWAPFIALGAVGGGFVARLLDADTLAIVFGLFVATLAVHLSLERGLPILRNPPAGPVASRIIASLIGLVSALMGIGGAVLTVPALRSRGLDMHRAISTGAAIGFFIAVPATASYLVAGLGIDARPPGSIGFVNVPAWMLLLPATLLSVPFGVRRAHRTNADVLRRAFALFLALVALRMILS